MVAPPDQSERERKTRVLRPRKAPLEYNSYVDQTPNPPATLEEQDLVVWPFLIRQHVAGTMYCESIICHGSTDEEEEGQRKRRDDAS